MYRCFDKEFDPSHGNPQGTNTIRWFLGNIWVLNVSRKKRDHPKQWPCIQGDKEDILSLLSF